MKNFGKAIALAALLCAAPGIRAGQTGRIALQPLGAAGPPDASGRRSLGRVDQAGIDGTITIKIYPAQQLGKAFDHYNMARDGIADFAHVNPGYEPGRFPIMGLSEIPFIFANSKEGSAALDAWYRKYADKEMKDVHYCLTFAHDPATFHTTNKKVVVPGDVKGMKIRPANATISRFVTSARRHQRSGLRTGIARPPGEGCGRRHHLPVGIDRAVRHRQGDEISPRRAALRHRADLRDEQGQVRALSPAQRKVIDDHCTPEWADKIADALGDMSRPDATRSRRSRARRSTRSRPRSLPNGARPPSRSMPNGPERQEGRLQSG